MASIILISLHGLTHCILTSAVIILNLQRPREGSVNIENKRLCPALVLSTYLCLSVKSFADLDQLNWGRVV